MPYKYLLIVCIAPHYAWPMDGFIKKNTRPMFYNSVLPGYISGNQVPSLRLLAAQKVYEMRQKKELTQQQRLKHEVAICNDFLNDDFLYMRKDRAQAYALRLFGTQATGINQHVGNVAQKRRALEMMIKAND